MLAPNFVDTCAHANCVVLVAHLVYNAGDFHTISASIFYIRAISPYYSEVYAPIVRVLRTTPLLVHCTTVVLVLHFQIGLRRPPHFLPHHLLVVPLLQSSCTAMI